MPKAMLNKIRLRAVGFAPAETSCEGAVTFSEGTDTHSNFGSDDVGDSSSSSFGRACCSLDTDSGALC